MADQPMTDAGEEEKDLDLSTPDVVTKYTLAGEIANRTLARIVTMCVPGTKIVEICSAGDAYIREQVAAVYKSSKFEKGIAFPTCVSVNNCCGHYSPLDEESTVLAAGDVAKIDLGAHIDGFIALVAHTHVVGGGDITGRQGDAIAAANAAAEAVLRTLKPGNKNSDVTKRIEQAISAFKCEPVDGVVSHQLKRFTIDGQKCIMSKAHPEKKVAECTFEENEVYAVDIVVSTGEGKAREADTRTTVFKRAVDNTYALKLKAARQLFHDVKEKHPHMPFSLRDFDSQRAKMGVVECVKHDLLQAYPVLYERPENQVVQIKFTVLLLPAGPLRITSHALQPHKSEHEILDEELKALLATDISRKKRRKKASGKKEGEMDTS